MKLNIKIIVCSLIYSALLLYCLLNNISNGVDALVFCLVVGVVPEYTFNPNNATLFKYPEIIAVLAITFGILINVNLYGIGTELDLFLNSCIVFYVLRPTVLFFRNRNNIGNI